MQENILIADSGSSKTDWRLINSSGIVLEYESLGLNPDFHSVQSLRKEFSSLARVLGDHSWIKMYFYGSGASSPKRKEPLERVVKEFFPQKEIFIDHDLMGAAKAVHGDDSGLVGILGTGSNCCSYDGNKIDQEFRSGGYILGDEGGGVYLGKMILKAFIEESLQLQLSKKFKEKYNLDTDMILQAIYKEALPNRFIASFSKFAKENEQHPQMAAFIQKNFEDFFELKVIRFSDYRSKKLGLVGSMASHFETQLRAVAAAFDVELAKIVGRPIDALCDYHRSKLEE